MWARQQRLVLYFQRYEGVVFGPYSKLEQGGLLGEGVSVLEFSVCRLHLRVRTCRPTDARLRTRVLILRLI